LNERRDASALLGSCLAETLSKCAQPAGDLVQAVKGRHEFLQEWQRGRALPADSGPLPWLCPPVKRCDAAALRSHTGGKDMPPNANLSAKKSPRARNLNLQAGMRELKRELTELPGEDLTTSALPEVAGWISIYEELASVLRSVITRANGSTEVSDLRRNLSWIEDRLAVWRDRHAELAGVLIDRKNHTVTYAGKSLRLTRREADLLDFLLRHPRRPFTSKQLATLAWQNSRLSDAQVRTYIMRLRKRLSDVGLEHVITVVRNRGYGIVSDVRVGQVAP
jgi:DNA-binding winged helix-turn-helix (wHTH) protein